MTVQVCPTAVKRLSSKTEPFSFFKKITYSKKAASLVFEFSPTAFDYKNLIHRYSFLQKRTVSVFQNPARISISADEPIQREI